MRINEMDEIDDYTWEILKRIAAIGNTSVRDVMDVCEKICNPETIHTQNFEDIVPKIQDLPRSPAEIKKILNMKRTL